MALTRTRRGVGGGERRRYHVHTEVLHELVREDTFQDRPHLVVPCVLVREMVLSNSVDEPGELLPFEAIRESVTRQLWEGRPVTVNHPTEDGQWISAGVLEVAELIELGRVQNAVADEELRALVGELWIDLEVAENVEDGPAIVEALNGAEVLEVSTGYWARAIRRSGTHNDRRFRSLQDDLDPDHLAILPGGIGKCSIEDGCGAGRLNEQPDAAGFRIMVLASLDREAEETVAAPNAHPTIRIEGAPSSPLWRRLARAFGDTEVEARPTVDLRENQDLSFSDVEALLRSALIDEERPGDSWLWIRAVFDDRVVYSIEDSGEIWERDYSRNGDVVELSADRTEVRQRTVFEPVDNRAGNPTEESMERDAIITALANCSDCPFDRVQLEAMEDGALEYLNTRPAGDSEGGDPDATANAAELAAAAAEIGPVLDPGIVEALNGLGPDGVAAVVESATETEATRAARHTELVAGLVANTRCSLEEAVLTRMDNTALEGLTRDYATGVRTTTFAALRGTRRVTPGGGGQNQDGYLARAAAARANRGPGGAQKAGIVANDPRKIQAEDED